MHHSVGDESKAENNDRCQQEGPNEAAAGASTAPGSRSLLVVVICILGRCRRAMPALSETAVGAHDVGGDPRPTQR
jgi:hypothetical protein